ncbi:hypothetical protein [Pseudoalteromonas sp. JC28]|uniref:hypothetical protein n=1 Tax=Pseudoalteromonas sp. JC28 TaxID=2267617 RepID=UPI0015728F6A|nr:hypothetical protein [Pseudoalteromonas sp. JC28]
MKIKLLVDLPIDEQHGAKKGKVFEVHKVSHDLSRDLYYFYDHAGQECAAWAREVEVIE